MTMTHASALTCHDDRARRQSTRKSPLFGLDYAELGKSGLELVVHFLGKSPATLAAANLRLDGGRRVRDIRITSVRFERSGDPTLDDRMIVGFDKLGDASRYQLRVLALDEDGRPLPVPPADFDPRYDRVSFTFALDCGHELDCKPTSVCADPVDPTPPAIDYLAKDYASFRQLLLDRLAVFMPDWNERHAPDLGITLVELIAYAADRLSYYQDAVATEAYLDTARTRISLRRHLRLVDYLLHEGCNARAWLAFTVGQPLSLARGTFFGVAGAAADGGGVSSEEAFLQQGAADAKIFEPVWSDAVTGIELQPERNAIRLYTWLGSECCLPRGATRATLLDPGQLQPAAKDVGAAYRLALAPCDVLIFEEVKGPQTGLPADADPGHRHVVRLTRADKSIDPAPDPATGRPTLIWEVEWSQADALPFPLCISVTAPAPSCQLISDVSVVRGNVLLVDHGSSTESDLPQVPAHETQPACEDACDGPESSLVAGRYRPVLGRTDLTYAEAIAGCWSAADGCSAAAPLSAASLALRDPRRALPAIELTGFPAAPNGKQVFTAADVLDPSALAAALAQRDAHADPDGPVPWLWRRLPQTLRRALERWAAGPTGTALPEAVRLQLTAALGELQQRWLPRLDLLDSGPDDRHFVVEVDDNRRAHLRFGDGDCGAPPPAAAYFRARYRSGNGTAGNVGAEAISCLVFRSQLPSGADVRVRNPLAAVGGSAPEAASDAKQRGPHAFRTDLQRAITADDYASIAARDFAAEVQRAAAVMRWNGHMAEVSVAIDPFAAVSCERALLCRIEQRLQRYRRIAHQVHVVPAERVPLRVRLHVCVNPDDARGHVEAALLARFSNRILPDGSSGFFHADRLTFGQAIYLSQLVAIAQAEPGVVSVRVDALERYGQGPDGELSAGLLALGALEIAQLDNDPSAPERGVLDFDMEGGR